MSQLSDSKTSHATEKGGNAPVAYDNFSIPQGTNGGQKGPGLGSDGAAVQGGSVKFVRYVSTRKDSFATFAVNQMLSDSSHSQSDQARNGRGMGDMGKRWDVLHCACRFILVIV